MVTIDVVILILAFIGGLTLWDWLWRWFFPERR